ncbi:Phage-related minor tail protein [Klenkia soli]|uniref:Phage-related minor tail protein n=1 Tax=Klenkia soli TaxID=1052260 RepID=A0A1H0C129_9ACTN|nr:phage tail tape measure protein [Klenkia soli]SDN51603.1 Phage-related minor tail protein [Klenkia soli]
MPMTVAELRATYAVDESPLERSLRNLASMAGPAGMEAGRELGQGWARGADSEVRSSRGDFEGAGENAAGGVSTGFDNGSKGWAASMGAKAAGIAVLVGATFVSGFMDAMEADQLSDRTAAALALTGPQAEVAGEVAGNLFAGAYTDSMGAANEAVEAVMSSISGMRDASEADLTDISGAALNLSRTFGVDVQRSAQVAGQMITNGLAGDGIEAFDLLVGASQKVPAAIRDDLFDATDEYGQFFATLGFTGEQAMDLLVGASEQGMYGIDKLGDSMKELGIRVTTMDANAITAFDSMGLNAQDMANRMLAGGGTAQQATQQIVDGLLSMTDPAAQAQAAVQLFGTPLEDLNTGEIPAFLQSLQDAGGGMEGFAGSTGRLGDQLNDNATARFNAFKQAAQQAFVEFIGDRLLPMLEDFVGWLRSTFGPAFDEIKNVFSAVAEAFSSDGEKAGGAIGRIQEVVQAVIDFVGPAFETLKSIFSTVVEVIVGLWDTFGDTILGYWSSTVENLGTVFQGALDIIQGILDVFIGLFTGDWSQVWDGVKGIFSGAWDVITGAFQQALNFMGTLASIGLTALSALMSSVWDGIKSAASSAWESIRGAVSTAWTNMVGAVSTGVTNAVEWVRGLPSRMLSALGNLGSLLASAGTDLLHGLWKGIQDAKSWLLRKVGDFFGDLLPGWVRDILGIASPSKVFAEMGHFLMLGLAQGIDGSASEAAAAAARAAAAVTLAGSTTMTPASLAAMGNQSAQASLMGGGTGGHTVNIGSIETMEAIDAADLSQKLVVEMRTRG